MCVSDSDDLLLFSLVQFPMSHHGGFGNLPREEPREKASLHLARLLEALEHFQISAIRMFPPAAYGNASSRPLFLEAGTRPVNVCQGRAPPCV